MNATGDSLTPMEIKMEESLLQHMEEKGDLEIAWEAATLQDTTARMEFNRAIHQRIDNEIMSGQEQTMPVESPVGDVLIRSPVVHNHYPPPPEKTAPPPVAAPVQPATSGSSMLPWILAALGTGVGGFGLSAFLNKPTTTGGTVINRTDGTSIKLLPPDGETK